MANIMAFAFDTIRTFDDIRTFDNMRTFDNTKAVGASCQDIFGSFSDKITYSIGQISLCLFQGVSIH